VGASYLSDAPWPGAERSLGAVVLPPQQLGEVGGDAPGLVMSQQFGQWRISANIPVDCIVDH
jgi:hypothetical protein